MTTGLRRALAILAIASAVLTGCGPGSDGHADAKNQGSTAKADAHKDGDGHNHGKESPGASGALKLSDTDIAAAGIKVEPLAEQPVRTRIVVPAEIQANQDRIAHVTPRIAGRIVKAPAALGERVRAGQTLAVLDSIELGEAQSAYLQAASRAATARADFERAEGLNRDQIISQKEYLRIRSEFQQSGAALRAAEDKLRLLGVAPPAATDRATSVFPLVAPFAGTVIEKDAVLGELAAPDRTLFTVADLSVLWVQATLFEKDLAMVKTGAAAEVTVAAYPNETFRGRVTYISDVFDKDTRTVRGAHRGGQRRRPAQARDVRAPPPSRRRRPRQGPARPGRGHRADGRPADGLRRGGARFRAAAGRARRPVRRRASDPKSASPPATWWSRRAPTRSRRAS